MKEHAIFPTMIGHERRSYLKEYKNVTIVFADIVGFTNMSTNVTAEHLVTILNDLFGTFDKLSKVSSLASASTRICIG